MSEGYNGCSNYETWNVCLWIDNEEGSYNYWRYVAQEIAEEIRDEDYDDEDGAKMAAVSRLADRMESELEEGMPEVSGFWADILTSAFQRIDWREAAATRFDDDEKFRPDSEDSV